MKFTVYKRLTGELVRQGEGSMTAYRAQLRPDRVVFDGHFAASHYYDPVAEELVELLPWSAALQLVADRLLMPHAAGVPIELSNLPDCVVRVNGQSFPIADGIARLVDLRPGHYLVQVDVPTVKPISEIVRITA